MVPQSAPTVDAGSRNRTQIADVRRKHGRIRTWRLPGEADSRSLDRSRGGPGRAVTALRELARIDHRRLADAAGGAGSGREVCQATCIEGQAARYQKDMCEALPRGRRRGWSRSSFCSDMRRFRRRSDTWGAARILHTRRMIGWGCGGETVVSDPRSKPARLIADGLQPRPLRSGSACALFHLQGWAGLDTASGRGMAVAALVMPVGSPERCRSEQHGAAERRIFA
jgi:hypothetical protein